MRLSRVRATRPDLLIQNYLPALFWLIRHAEKPEEVEKLRELARGLLVTRTKRGDRPLHDVVWDADETFGKLTGLLRKEYSDIETPTWAEAGSVAVELDEPLVRDAEVMRDFVQHDAPDRVLQALRVASVQALQRSAEDRDLVGQRAGVEGTAVRERHTLVEAQEGHARRRLLLDDDLHVGHEPAELWRQRVERVTDNLVELHGVHATEGAP
jgi:hypothetical protein